jgi:hypothetical protein
MFCFFRFFSNKPKVIPNKELDEFDIRFGFMLKYKITDIGSYNRTKDYFYYLNQK